MTAAAISYRIPVAVKSPEPTVAAVVRQQTGVAWSRARRLCTEGRVTLIDGLLAAAVLLGLVLNAACGWWWADPAAGYMLVYYAVREVKEIFAGSH